MMEIYGLNGGLSKQFTVVCTVIPLKNPTIWVLQFVGGSGPILPKYNISNCPGATPGIVILYSPPIAISPGRHDTVELTKGAVG